MSDLLKFSGFLIFAISVVLALPVSAGVYKWVDEQGRVHYGDRPESQRAAPVEIRPPAGSPPPAPRDRGDRQRRLSNTLESDRVKRLEDRRRQEARKAELTQRCNLARDRMRRFESAGYLYDLDAAGERRVLNETQRRQATRKVQADIEKYCR